MSPECREVVDWLGEHAGSYSYKELAAALGQSLTRCVRSAPVTPARAY